MVFAPEAPAPAKGSRPFLMAGIGGILWNRRSCVMESRRCARCGSLVILDDGVPAIRACPACGFSYASQGHQGNRSSVGVMVAIVAVLLAILLLVWR